MYSIEYDFFPDPSKTDAESFYNGPLSSFLASLYRSSILIGDPWNLVPLEDRIRLFGIIPTPDALDARHYNTYARADLERLLEQSRQPPCFRIVGKVLELPDCCSCEEPGWYVLKTDFLNDGPPVQCGDCGRPVPLFRLPLLENEGEHSAVLRWDEIYQAYDTLFIQSSVGERSGYRQMSRLNSGLTREGRKICRAMAEGMGKPWYYYLNRYDDPQEPVCPGCGGPWKLTEPLHRLYDYKCDRCCLLSSEP
jgi:predicted  nucleic acid-binding Zn ribbon protein